MERSVLILILLLSLSLPIYSKGSESINFEDSFFYQNYDKLQNNFIFWMQINTKNNTINYQKIALSQSMKKTNKDIFSCQINLNTQQINKLKNQTNIIQSQNSLYDIINSKKDEIINCLKTTKAQISDTMQAQTHQTTSNTNLTIMPTSFQVQITKQADMLIFIDKN